MEFVDDEHEKFWEEKNLIMQKYGKTDVYYKFNSLYIRNM